MKKIIAAVLAATMLFTSIPCSRFVSRTRTYSGKIGSIYRVGNGRGASRSQRW
jgi:hypothetical protein